MTHWLLDLAIKAYPARNISPQTQLPETPGERWELVAALAGVTSHELAQMVADRFALKRASVSQINKHLAQVLPARIARRHGILPVSADDRTLTIVCSDPTDDEAVKEAAFVSSRHIERLIAPPHDIDSWMTLLYAQGAAGDRSNKLKMLDLDDREVAMAIGDNAPVTRLCRALLKKAIDGRASDIHAHPFAGGGVVRFRIDGVLHRIATLPGEILDAVLRFFKAQGKMDPTNSRVPQDGRASVTLGNLSYDLRVSSLPATGGESLVIRILDPSRVYSLQESHFASATSMALRRISASANGLFLLTGPTGSGKTSTLYALLAALNNVSRRIITVEEPVEYQIPGITQIEVNAQAGLGFETALRAILRQDPDILLIGEIRDKETADIAVNAALTGHLVFATLHTMDAMRAIPRLVELGVRPTVLADTLVGVMSQRLMRKLCTHCRAPVVEPLAPLERLFRDLTDESPVYRAVGCAECNYTGYSGRLPVAEVIEVNDRLRAAFLANRIDNATLVGALPDGWQSIQVNAANWIVSGESTPEEAYANLGTAFWTALSHSSKRRVPIQDAIAQASNHSSATALTALVVTPDPALGNRLVDLLGHAAYQARWEATGSGARAILEANQDVQLLIADTAAGGDSEDMLRNLRRELAWSGLPVILLVDPAESDFLALLESFGVTDFLHKPVVPELLISRAQSVLHR
ncbi:ATPase, T2SS/T4P/T4SS family [Paucibacter sp. AS339]|uniref:ATPase, T2SS/T4P/T4SS family n=1 Tax=Paucibacter hankyongi TaxID=3133434 RepID=UPI00309FFB76